jgi:hypothetical protein
MLTAVGAPPTEGGAAPVVWTEDAFLRTFAITRDTLLAWIAEGLPT